MKVALALLAALWAAPEVQAPQTFAIIIGNNASPPEAPELKPLQFADDDAVRYLQLFERLADEVHLLTVLDAPTQRRHSGLATRAQPPSLEVLRRTFGEIRAKAKPGSTVYLVFSGHGANDPRGTPFLAMLDRGLTQKILFEELLGGLSATRVHLIIDACNAGAVVGSRGPFDREVEARSAPVSPQEVAAVVRNEALAKMPHVGAIIATSAGQESHEWTRIESGVFTHELLSGAYGPADINGDLRIEYSEILAFVASANSAVKDPRAKPNIQAIPPALDQRTPLFSFSKLKGPFLRSDGRSLGRFFIELSSGQRYLEAHLSAQTPFLIVLPNQTQAYLRTPSSEAKIPAVASGTLSLADLDFRTVAMASRGSLDDDLRRSLFAAPYDRAYYRGYVDSRALVGVDLSASARIGNDTWTWKERAAVGLFSGAGVAAVTALGTGIAAIFTRRDFEQTTLMRRADELAARYDALRIATWVFSAVSAASLGSGLWLWFSAAPSEPKLGQSASGFQMIGLSGNF